jgi:hypothetical protein
MSFRQRLLLLALVAFQSPIFAQIDDPEGEFRLMRRSMEGTWFMPTDRGDRLEIWEIADDSTLLGRGLRIKPENGDTVRLETMRLTLRDTNIVYSVTVRGQNNNQPVPFPLVRIDDEGFYVFENPKHDDPQRIRYLLLSNREIQVVTETARNGRVVKQEYVFEREFTPGAVEFRLRGGLNYHNLRGTGYFPSDVPNQDPVFDWKPSWELGIQTRFKGRGGFVTVNAELGLVGRSAHAQSAFTVVGDTSVTAYKRDLTYHTTWLEVALMPEITFRRDGRLSLLAGPYYARLLGTRGKGLEEPANENKLFKANNDFKKNDLGIHAGLQYRLNFGKKDLGGLIGLRANLGLANLDNLYGRGIQSAALRNGRVSFMGASLYYSVNLLKI